MLVIALVAILVVGPKDLPGMLRQLGKTIGSVKRMAGDFQRQFNDAVKDAELDDLKDMTSAKGFSPLEDAKKSMEEFTKSVEDSVNATPDAIEQTAENSVEEIEAPAVAPKTTAKTAKSATGPRKTAKSTAGAKSAVKKPAAKAKTSTRTSASKSTTTRKASTQKPAAKTKTSS